MQASASPSNTFSIQLNNLSALQSDGSSNRFLSADDLTIPPNSLPGAPSNLAELVQFVGPNNISMSYYCEAAGYVTGHLCSATYVLYCQASYTNNTKSQDTFIAVSEFARGGPIVSTWYPIVVNTNNLINNLTTKSVCSGACCTFEYYGGWKNTTINLRIDVIVNLLNYCTLPGTQNIYSDICYNYIADYINKNGATQQITDYLGEYCASKYPSASLETFADPNNPNPKDNNICACNLPQEVYNQFEQSLDSHFPNLDLGSIRPNCLVPACVVSRFKNNKLDGCQIPKCLNVVNFSGNNISGSVVVDQNQQCSSRGIATGGSGSNKNIWSEYKWPLIILIIILLILIFLVIFLTTKKKKYTK